MGPGRSPVSGWWSSWRRRSYGGGGSASPAAERRDRHWIGTRRLVLRTPLTSPYFGALTTENQVRILDAYWRGIEKVLPECFVGPGYLVQAPTGVDVLHGLLVSILEHVRSHERSVVEPAVYADVLNTVLPELEGLTVAGDSVRGPDFWREGAEGAASSYSSNAGRRVLTAKLLAMLPRLEVA